MKFTDRVKEFLDEKCQLLATRFYVNTITQFDELEEEQKITIESPVEQLFYIEWLFRKFCYPDFSDIYLKPQYQDESTGKFRLDFAVEFLQAAYIKWGESIKYDQIILSIEHPKLGIEIDGHIWHEKTKDQVQCHKERERFLISMGWKLLRFTGSEVFKNPQKCIHETIELIESVQNEYYGKIREKIQRER